MSEEPRKIHPNQIYSAEELSCILRGSIKIETLRQHDLIGLKSGYWGQNVIDAINEYLEYSKSQRGRTVGKVYKQDGKTKKNNSQLRRRSMDSRRSRQKIQGDRNGRNAPIHPNSASTEKMETQRERLERLTGS